MFGEAPLEITSGCWDQAPVKTSDNKSYTADDHEWKRKRTEELRAKYGDGDGVDWSPEGQALWEMQHDRTLLPDQPQFFVKGK
jgi:hypothetical protein